LDPLQEGEEKMMKEIDEYCGQVEMVGLENEELMKEDITTETLDTFTEKKGWVNLKLKIFQAGSRN
jgi:hypothetical protein